MAGYVRAEGLDQLSRMLQKVGNNAGEIAAAGLYAGAGVVADALTAAVDSIVTEEFKYAPPGQKRLPSPEEKAALKNRTGIAKFRGSSTEIDTMVGFKGAGYVTLGDKRKAVILIANSINSGTSFMLKQPVFRRAISKSRGAATDAIVETADKVIHTLTVGNVSAADFAKYFPKR